MLEHKDSKFIAFNNFFDLLWMHDLLTFLHDALAQSLSDKNTHISYWVRREAEQTGQKVLAELIHGHAVLLHYSLQKI